MVFTDSPLKHPLKRIIQLISLVSLSACLELFDFISFIFMAPILSQVFFSSQNHTQGLLFTLLIFSAGYFCRPVGGIIMAHFGDRYGRKNIFILSLALMSLPSLSIALLPSPVQLGLAAPILLAVLRMMQGISLGGEIAGSITYVAESSPPRWRTLACSFIPAASNMGVILAAFLAHALNHYLSPEQMLQFGWRLPFLIGACLGLVALYLRKNFVETPLFLEMQQRKQLEKTPLLQVFKHDLKPVLFGVFISMIVSNATSTFHLFLPVYLTQYLQYGNQDIFPISIAGILSLSIFTPLFAWKPIFKDRLKQALLGSVLLCGLCVSQAFFHWQNRSLLALYLLIISLSITIAIVNSVFMALIADSFPTARRFTGVALSYNLGFLLGAGFTPAINSYLINTTAFLNMPFILVATIAALSSTALVYIRSHN